MPKSIIIAPERVFSREVIRFSDIPVNAYATSLKEELANYSKEDLVSIWLDMCAIREFETILGEIKTKGTYKGVAYTHAGPAHLSIGQEAAAVGMAFLLGPEDHVFGSHRSHGEILAKGFSAIRQLSDEQLFDIMRSCRDGALLAPVERGHAGTVKSLARRFFVYGAYGEVFARLRPPRLEGVLGGGLLGGSAWAGGRRASDLDYGDQQEGSNGAFQVGPPHARTRATFLIIAKAARLRSRAGEAAQAVAGDAGRPARVMACVTLAGLESRLR